MLPAKEFCKIVSDLDGNCGLYVEDMETGDIFTINAEKVFPAASIIKIPLLAALLADVEAGRISLDDKIPLSKKDWVSGTGIIKYLDDQYVPTVRDLATLMIIVSDNLATNKLISLVTMERVNELCNHYGLKHTKLQRKMLDTEATRKGLDNFTSAGDMCLLLKMLVQGKIVSAQASETIINTMKKQQYRSKLCALIPAVPTYADFSVNDPIPENRVVVANKTGGLPLTEHDVGIFILPGDKKYIIAMLTNQLKADSYGIEAIAKVSLAAYEALSK